MRSFAALRTTVYGNASGENPSGTLRSRRLANRRGHAAFATRCASILWRSNANAQEAAEAMKVTAADLKKLEIIDDVIPEPMGGATGKVISSCRMPLLMAH